MPLCSRSTRVQSSKNQLAERQGLCLAGWRKPRQRSPETEPAGTPGRRAGTCSGIGARGPPPTVLPPAGMLPQSGRGPAQRSHLWEAGILVHHAWYHPPERPPTPLHSHLRFLLVMCSQRPVEACPAMEYRIHAHSFLLIARFRRGTDASYDMESPMIQQLQKSQGLGCFGHQWYLKRLERRERGIFFFFFNADCGTL